VLSYPQLYQEGNHRTGAPIASGILLQSGCPPFVLTRKNAIAYFNPSSGMRHIIASMRLKMAVLGRCPVPTTNHRGGEARTLTQPTKGKAKVSPHGREYTTFSVEFCAVHALSGSALGWRQVDGKLKKGMPSLDLVEQDRTYFYVTKEESTSTKPTASGGRLT
jgi:hypothetical protein